MEERRIVSALLAWMQIRSFSMSTKERRCAWNSPGLQIWEDLVTYHQPWLAWETESIATFLNSSLDTVGIVA